MATIVTPTNDPGQLTFLQLAQRLRQEVSGSGSGPTSVLNQTGELKRIIDWIITADEDVQRKHNDWKFMVGSFTIDTTASNGSYTCANFALPVSFIRDWKLETLKIYLLSSGVSAERPLEYIDYMDWYSLYNTGNQTDSTPIHFTVAPDKSIKLGPKPNGVYRISGEYGKVVTPLVNATDIPVYPGEYHLLAVYRGMMKYGRFTGAQEIYDDGKIEYDRMMGEMERAQRPEIRMAGPMA